MFAHTSAALALGLFAGLAQAAPINYFGELPEGWGVGSGQPNGGFAISESSSPEFRAALRSQDYQVGISANDGVSRYFVDAGERSPGTGLSKWNLDLSLKSGEGLIESTFDVVLQIDWDPTAGENIVSYDIDAWLANSGLTALQFSENLGFAFWGQAFDPFATGTYSFVLSAFDRNDPAQLVARTAIDVVVSDAQAVPEPGSFALAGLALAGLAASRRRRTVGVS